MIRMTALKWHDLKTKPKTLINERLTNKLKIYKNDINDKIDVKHWYTMNNKNNIID